MEIAILDYSSGEIYIEDLPNNVEQQYNEIEDWLEEKGYDSNNISFMSLHETININDRRKKK